MLNNLGPQGMITDTCLIHHDVYMICVFGGLIHAFWLV